MKHRLTMIALSAMYLSRPADADPLPIKSACTIEGIDDTSGGSDPVNSSTSVGDTSPAAIGDSNEQQSQSGAEVKQEAGAASSNEKPAALDDNAGTESQAT